MTLTSTVNDIIEQAASLLSPPDMSDWAPPADGDIDAAEQAEHDRRVKARLDAYLADRSDRLELLRAIREGAQARAAAYTAQAHPWLVRAKQQARTAEYVEQLARNVLEAERTAAGLGADDPYEVTVPSGRKFALRKSKAAVKILDLEELPGRYVKTTKAAMKDEIYAALKAGKVVTGARLEAGFHVSWGR